MQHPVGVAVVEDHEILAAGVTALLARFPDRVRVVDLGSGEAEVLLYGLREDGHPHDAALHLLLRQHPATVVIALTWNSDDPRLDGARSCGVAGWLARSATAEELVRGVVTARGLRPATRDPDRPRRHPAALRLGLTPREVDVLRLISRGLTNREAAEQLGVSANSVKSYVRAAYRKIGVTRRSQAVAWALAEVLDHPAEPTRAPGPRCGPTGERPSRCRGTSASRGSGTSGRGHPAHGTMVRRPGATGGGPEAAGALP